MGNKCVHLGPYTWY